MYKRLVKVVIYLPLIILFFKPILLNAISISTPTIKRITPNIAKPGDRMEIAVEGDFFQPEIKVSFGNFINVQEIRFVSPKKLEVDILISHDSPDTNVSIMVTNPDGIFSGWKKGFTIKTPPPTLEEHAKSYLLQTQRRNRPKFVVEKDKVSLECLKKAIKIELQKYGFEFHQPVFDDYNQLMTYPKDLKGQIVTEKDHYEKIVVATNIVEKNNKYSVFAVAVGNHRLRKSDTDQAIKIPETYLEKFVDRIIKKIDFKNCHSDKLKLVLTWDTKTDIDLHVVTPNGEECFYRNKKISAGFLDYDNQKGFGPETFTLHTDNTGTYAIKICYYAGALQTNVTLSIIDATGNKKYHGTLEKKGDCWIRKFNYESGILKPLDQAIINRYK